MTKAQLEARIAELETKVTIAERDAARAESARKFHLGAYNGLVAGQEETGVTVYVARASKGSPTCIYALGTTPDDDLAVALYLDSGRNLVGVVITDGQGDEVAGAGLVPFDRLAE